MEPVNSTSVRVRIAPSPTGFIHIGNLRTFLYNYLFARHHGGTFIVRIEDTDQTRFVEGAVENLLESLDWTHIEVDEGPHLKNGKIVESGEFGPYTQSKRLKIYQNHITTLIDKKKAYYCFCTKERIDTLRDEQRKQKLPAKYDGLCRDLTKPEVAKRISGKESTVIRFRMPENKDIVFDDAIRGTITVNTNDLDDFVLIKTDGFPTYHFANIIDDHLMKITHIMRGEEWIASTPKHVMLYEAFGWHAPIFAHLPVILNKDKKKMSKRDGNVSIADFMKDGYLKAALINFIALLGWNAGTDQETYTFDELVKQFSLENVHKSGAIFDVDKLDWLNGLYIRELTPDKFLDESIPFLIESDLIRKKGSGYKITSSKESISRPYLKEICTLEQTRIKKLSDLPFAVEYFFNAPDELSAKDMVWKKSTKTKTKNILKEVIEYLTSIDDKKYTLENLEKSLMAWIESKGYGNGDVLWPIRYSLSGRDRSPSPFELLSVLGKEESIKRLDTALQELK